MLVANKIDLSNRVVTRQEAQLLAKSHGMLYAEASAKTQEGVVAAFEELVIKIVEEQNVVDQRGDRLSINSSEDQALGCGC